MKLAKAKTPTSKSRTRSVVPKNPRLLKLAAKRKPPQSWYDETVNPFIPVKQANR